jgi:hypothetical protein
MTPNIGLGGNTAMESVVVLANLLNQTIKESPQGKPNAAALHRMLNEYQRLRLIRAKQFIEISGLVTKMQAWENGWYKFMTRIVPFLPDTTFANHLSNLLRGAPKLDFIPVPGNPQGTVKWDDDVFEAKQREAKSGSAFGRAVRNILSWTTTPILSLAAVYSVFYMVQGAKALSQTQTVVNI